MDAIKSVFGKETPDNRQKLAMIAAEVFARKAHPGMVQPKIIPPAMPPDGWHSWEVFNRWIDNHRPQAQPANGMSREQINAIFGL